MNMKRLGIIGGQGPMATAYFLELLTKMTDAGCDQNHIESVIYNIPGIPDRTAYILGKTNHSPCEYYLDIGMNLVRDGAKLLAIPCVTAHNFYDTLVKKLPIPIIHIISETVAHIHKQNIQYIGVLATEGTIRCGLFQKECLKYGIHVLTPTQTEQQKITDIVYRGVKANRPIDLTSLYEVTDALHLKGAERILLGCTELSVLRKEYALHDEYIDALEVLAKRTIELCGAKLKIKGNETTLECLKRKKCTDGSYHD